MACEGGFTLVDVDKIEKCSRREWDYFIEDLELEAESFHHDDDGIKWLDDVKLLKAHVGDVERIMSALVAGDYLIGISTIFGRRVLWLGNGTNVPERTAALEDALPPGWILLSAETWT